ncbi:MAG: peptidoglycan DD-metalloendopeptidase family protein [Oleibacter sp.]|nr:peptidoglycan DD-metalloendopeptidase family protein [Thalassolituus sp.]
MIKPIQLSFVFFIISAWLASPVLADEQQQLEKVKADIRQLEVWLKEARSEYDSVNRDLRNSDKDIAELVRKIENTRKELAEEQSRLKKLQAEQAQLHQLQQQHQLKLTEQIRTDQRLGSESALRFWLAQDDPVQQQRLTKYFGYFNRARIDEIRTTIDTLERLNNIETLIAQQTAKLRNTEKVLVTRRSELDREREEQKKILARLNKQMSSEEQRLQTRRADRSRLESLLAEVANMISRSIRGNDETPFAKLRGKLPRPATGKVLLAYGNRNDDNKTRSEGWRIRVSEGDSVKAIHHGRVVFSDWLRGFGLLIIVDHGSGYLSLYAHNQSLLRDVGSWVSGGDVIAKGGKSGGQADASLYFEIRHKGQPVDPAIWIKRG